MYFCTDTDLLTWEPGLFFEDAFAHQAILRDAPATLTGTALVTADPLLGNVVPGMVVAATLGDDAPAQLLEVVAVADASHATVSALRGRTAEPPIPALAGGAASGRSGATGATDVSSRRQLALAVWRARMVARTLALTVSAQWALSAR